MRVAAAITVLAGLVAQVYAKCDNSCSGHGTCTYKDVCQCWQDWRTGEQDGGDCSDRTCPFELAWVDTPDENGYRHKYAECAGKGICDRSTGECQCFDGYTGKACQRTTCPNDCSGHGRCEYMEDLPFGTVWGDYYLTQPRNLPVGSSRRWTWVSAARTGPPDFLAKGLGDQAVTFTAGDLWDNHKSRACVCDPTWTDVDCSRRMCPRGTDVLAERLNLVARQKYQVQTILLQSQQLWNVTAPYDVSTWTDLTFALKFTSTLNESYTTYPLKFPNLYRKDYNRTLDDDIRLALLRLPHRVVDDVEVSVAFPGVDEWTGDNTTTWDYYSTDYANTWDGSHNVSISITFTGDYVQGPQHLISVLDYACGDGCTPKITGVPLNAVYQPSFVREEVLADFNNFECGRRGKCDYDSGLCQCFDGYTGEACGMQTALI